MRLSAHEARRLHGLTPLEFHERYHDVPLFRAPDDSYHECRGWPCRMRTLRGRLGERWTAFLRRSRLFRIRDWWWDRGREEGQ